MLPTFANRIETWGYGALWIPEGFGREAFSASAWLLANTRKLIVATGIANIYARDAFTTAAAQKGLNEQSDGRFLLGVARRLKQWRGVKAVILDRLEMERNAVTPCRRDRREVLRRALDHQVHVDRAVVPVD